MVAGLAAVGLGGEVELDHAWVAAAVVEFWGFEAAEGGALVRAALIDLVAGEADTAFFTIEVDTTWDKFPIKRLPLHFFNIP